MHTPTNDSKAPSKVKSREADHLTVIPLTALNCMLMFISEGAKQRAMKSISSLEEFQSSGRTYAPISSFHFTDIDTIMPLAVLINGGKHGVSLKDY